MYCFLRYISIALLIFPIAQASAQQFKGKVIAPDGSPVSYVNVGILGKNIGTVTDMLGNFTLELHEKFDEDSVRFSMIGYLPLTRNVRSLRNDTSGIIILHPQTYSLSEIKISSRKFRKIIIGTPVPGNELRSGFSENELGSELGVRINTRRPVLLREIILNVGACTYDSVTYRMNIYKALQNDLFENILNKPVYLRFSRLDTSKPVVIDISNYYLQVDGDILVTLELYRNLGEGKLLFNTQYFLGTTYHRKVSQGSWTRSSGAVGIYFNALIIN